MLSIASIYMYLIVYRLLTIDNELIACFINYARLMRKAQFIMIPRKERDIQMHENTSSD